MKTLTRLWSKLVRWECAWVESRRCLMILWYCCCWWFRNPGNQLICGLSTIIYKVCTSQVVSRNYSINDILKVGLLYKNYLAIFLTVVTCLFWFLWNFASGCKVAGCRQCGLTTTTTTTTTEARTYPWWWFTTDFLSTKSWVTLMWRFWYIRLWSQALQLLRRIRDPGFVGVTEWVKGGRSQVVLPPHPCSRHVSPCFFGILHFGAATLLLGEGKSKKEESLAGMKKLPSARHPFGVTELIYQLSLHASIRLMWILDWFPVEKC